MDYKNLERNLTAARHVHGIYSEQAQQLERQMEEIYYRVGAIIWTEYNQTSV